MMSYNVYVVPQPTILFQAIMAEGKQHAVAVGITSLSSEEM